jgi:hypothetical protein
MGRVQNKDKELSSVEHIELIQNKGKWKPKKQTLQLTGE